MIEAIQDVRDMYALRTDDDNESEDDFEVVVETPRLAANKPRKSVSTRCSSLPCFCHALNFTSEDPTRMSPTHSKDAVTVPDGAANV